MFVSYQIQMPQISAALSVTASPTLLVAGRGAELAGTIALEALGLHITGTTFRVLPGPFDISHIEVRWTLNLGPAGLLQRLAVELRQQFFVVVQEAARRIQDDTGMWLTLGLPGPADEQTARRAYRDTCKKVHPDAGGSHEAMTHINASWEKICRTMGWA